MADRLDDRRDRPVVYGLLALVGVATVVGLVLGLAALGGARVLGVDGATTTSGGDPEASMYLPKPQKTDAPEGPAVTLAPGAEATLPEASPGETKQPKKKKAKPISLSAGQTSVSPMQQIDLSGTYPGGEGAILQVQRFENGSWQDFPVTASVSNQTFSTYVQTGQTGQNRFRVVDTDSGKASNEVKVAING